MSYYQELFDYMHDTFGVTALETEMQDIEQVIGKHICKQLSEKDYCPLPDEYRRIKTISTAVNCETTVEVCGLCGKHLTEPKTDCI